MSFSVGNKVKVTDDCYIPMTAINLKGEIGDIIAVIPHLYPYQVIIKGLIYTLSGNQIERLPKFNINDGIKLLDKPDILEELKGKTGKITAIHQPSTDEVWYTVALSEDVIIQNQPSTNIWKVSEDSIELNQAIASQSPLVSSCTCDLMLLMQRGCKCGYIEIERNKNKES